MDDQGQSPESFSHTMLYKLPLFATSRLGNVPFQTASEREETDQILGQVEVRDVLLGNPPLQAVVCFLLY